MIATRTGRSARTRRGSLSMAAALTAAALLAGCAGLGAHQSAGTGPPAGGAATAAASSPADIPPVGAAIPAVALPDVTVGPTDPSTPIDVQIVLQQPARGQIDAFLASLSDPASPDYHRYLTAAQYGARFGPDDAAIARVNEWLRAGGFRPGPLEPQRTQVRARGTVGAAERLFGVTFSDHRRSDGLVFYEAAAAPRIPASLQDAVAVVAGLSNRPVMAPAFGPPLTADVRPGGMLPGDVLLAYDIKPLADAGMDGTGQTVAIVSFDSFLDSDVAAWDQLTGTSGGGRVEHVPVTDPVQPGPGTDEVNLDIQTIRSIAPKATILDYEMSNTGGNFADMMSKIVSDGRADIVNISWSHCEADLSAGARQAAEAQFQAAFAGGISVYVASGDRGAYDCNLARHEGDLTVSVGYPEDLPYVMGVGGTTLSVRQDGTYHSEAAWANPLEGSGTGGGMSTKYQRPSWQQAAGIDPSKAGRLVPDIAGPADSSTGIIITYTPSDGSARVKAQGGGTSMSAPFWAGITALIRQYADQQGALPTQNGVKRIGALAPTLYALAADTSQGPLFHDVTLGSNLLDAAGKGWDAATGLGTPIVAPLAQAIVARLRAGAP